MSNLNYQNFLKVKQNKHLACSPIINYYELVINEKITQEKLLLSMSIGLTCHKVTLFIENITSDCGKKHVFNGLMTRILFPPSNTQLCSNCVLLKHHFSPVLTSKDKKMLNCLYTSASKKKLDMYIEDYDETLIEHYYKMHSPNKIFISAIEHLVTKHNGEYYGFPIKYEKVLIDSGCICHCLSFSL